MFDPDAVHRIQNVTPNYSFSRGKSKNKTSINPYIHWVLCRYDLYAKCYTGVTFFNENVI